MLLRREQRDRRSAQAAMVSATAPGAIERENRDAPWAWGVHVRNASTQPIYDALVALVDSDARIVSPSGKLQSISPGDTEPCLWANTEEHPAGWLARLAFRDSAGHELERDERGTSASSASDARCRGGSGTGAGFAAGGTGAGRSLPDALRPLRR